MPDAKPILISAGGTGGGVYPAVAVAEALRRLAPHRPLIFLGSAGGMERALVPRDLFAAYHEVQSGPLNGVSRLRMAISLVKLAIGTAQAWWRMGQTRPSVVFLTGGWATFPAALAAWLRRIPIAVFLPDIEPARAIQVMRRLSRLIMATTAESATYFPAGTTVIATGYPLRQAVIAATRPAAVTRFALDPTRQTLLVFGGSRGARSINQALSMILPELLADGLQIIHISGDLNKAQIEAGYAALPAADRPRYHAFSYLHSADMGLALAVADLVVSRAGASTLGEFPHFGLAAVLVPYPFAWRYQKVNADWLASRGAAIRLNDEAMPTDLLPTIRGLLHDPTRLDAMRQASAALARPGAADDIARRLLAL